MIRKMLGWSQESLGERLGISQRHYGRIEKGETHIRLDRLETLCDELGITLPQLTGMEVEQLYDLIAEKQNKSNKS